MADVLTLNADEKDVSKIVAVVRQLVERFQPSEDLASASEGALIAANNLSDLANAATARTNLAVVAKAGDTMTGELTVQAGASNTFTEFFRAKPTDYANNIPYLTIQAGGVTATWAIALWDGTDNGGTINLSCGTLTHNSNTIWDAVTLPQFASGAAGYVPASGGGTANFLRADASWAAPTSGGLTVLSYAGAVGTGTTYTVTGLGGYKAFMIFFREVSHNSGSSQSFRVELSGDGGSTWGSPLTPNGGSPIFTAANAASGLFFISNVDQTNNQQATISSLITSSLLTDTSNRGPINALRFSPSGGNFDNGSIDIYGLK